MSYISAGIYCQPLVTAGGGSGTECDPYSRPSPLAVITDLNFPVPATTPSAVVTNLCAEVS